MPSLSVKTLLAQLWLANCYLAHDSLRFPVLLPFFNASSRRPFHPVTGELLICRFFSFIGTLAHFFGSGYVRSMFGESGRNDYLLSEESLQTTLHQDTARHTHFPIRFKSPLFHWLEVVRPGGFELPAFWFVGKQSKILSAASGVAYRGTRHLSRS